MAKDPAGMIQTTVILSQELSDKLRYEAFTRRISQSEIIRSMLEARYTPQKALASGSK